LYLSESLVTKKPKAKNNQTKYKKKWQNMSKGELLEAYIENKKLLPRYTNVYQFKM
jgi:hypothetical protein